MHAGEINPNVIALAAKYPNTFAGLCGGDIKRFENWLSDGTQRGFLADRGMEGLHRGDGAFEIDDWHAFTKLTTELNFDTSIFIHTITAKQMMLNLLEAGYDRDSFGLVLPTIIDCINDYASEKYNSSLQDLTKEMKKKVLSGLRSELYPSEKPEEVEPNILAWTRSRLQS